MTKFFEEDAGSRFGIERRRSPRFTFAAEATALDPASEMGISGRVTQISMTGCYFEGAKTFPQKTVLQLAIEKAGRHFGCWASVAHVEAGHGMGIAFLAPENADQAILNEWIAELTPASPTVNQ